MTPIRYITAECVYGTMIVSQWRTAEGAMLALEAPYAREPKQAIPACMVRAVRPDEYPLTSSDNALITSDPRRHKAPMLQDDPPIRELARTWVDAVSEDFWDTSGTHSTHRTCSQPA